MEMNMGKLSEKLVELLELAKKKKNVLEYQEINDFFKDQPLGVEQMEKVFDFLEASGVDVLRITDNNADDMILDDDDADIDNLDEEEIELFLQVNKWDCRNHLYTYHLKLVPED